MDDITVYGGTFEECLINLEAVLHRCIEKDLVLNWEKCHFMVRQGIVLGHIISEKGIEVDKAKVELIVKLPSPTTVKGVRQFLVKTPSYAHIANYLVMGEIPSEWNAQDRKHFFAKIHSYYWEESFLFKYCVDQIIRKCVPENEQQGILSHCHENACGGHFASQKTSMKVLQSGFTWPSLFKDAHIMCRSCDRC